MIKINFVSSDIRVVGSDKKFGFRFDFSSGLNIITGQNSSGKSSILSCIYYNLGMEQLLGMSTSKKSLLDKCLTSEFLHKDQTYSVTQSIISLGITNHLGNTVLLERIAVSPDSEEKNRIIVEANGERKPYYIHNTNDHNDKHGFYRWLQSFIGIDLPTEGSGKKYTLYLQNLFSSCFIEQTKGWSDFMAQMPSFNIKDSKRKLIEYMLSLECLENDIEKDKLKIERSELVEEWNRTVKSFERFEHSIIYKPDGISRRFEKAKEGYFSSINLKVKADSEWEPISTVIKNVNKRLNNLRIGNRASEKRKDLSITSERRRTLKLNLIKLNRVRSNLERSYIAEKMKRDSYTIHLNRLVTERESLIGASKVDGIFSELVEKEHCPLCDSSIVLDEHGKEITSQDYDNSINFLSSKISMVKNYLESFSSFEEDYSKNCRYYDELINSIRDEISDIDRDINSGVDGEFYRSLIKAEIKNSDFLEKLSKLYEEFEKFKVDLTRINKRVIDIDVELKDLRNSSDKDNAKILEFQQVFRKHLKEFHYNSNRIGSVNIRTENPYKVFPSVFNASANSHQPIRLASSASDFIRSEWSYYLSLLKFSTVHPGVLIFDEPGQHAMSFNSVRNLLLNAEKVTDKQIIFAISKSTKGYDDDKEQHDISIEQLTQGLVSFRQLEIDKNGPKLVSEFK